jgi:hypothetical protein
LIDKKSSKCGCCTPQSLHTASIVSPKCLSTFTLINIFLGVIAMKYTAEDILRQMWMMLACLSFFAALLGLS